LFNPSGNTLLTMLSTPAALSLGSFVGMLEVKDIRRPVYKT
jgi:hypothetical protein